MDQELMARALKSVLGDGYETQSRHVGGGSSKTPSPHDFLQGRVSKSSPVGGDLHVPTTLGEDKPKKKARLKKIEYVGKRASSEKLDSLGSKLTAAGAVGGVLSLPSLAEHTGNKLREGGILKPKPIKTGWPARGAMPKAIEGVKGALKPVSDVLKNPKVGAGLAAGAAGLEIAGLAGDAVAHHQLKNRVSKADDDLITFSKVDDDKMQVFGWFSISKKDGVEVVDLQGDYVPIEEIEKSAYDYMLRSRKGGNQHARIAKADQPLHVADVIESMVFTPEKIEQMGLPENFPQGWWGGFQIHDDETWGQIKRGERAGFSIHGLGRREELVSKAKTETQAQIDRNEQIKDIGLGTAGATAAGAGATGALLPVAGRKGLMNEVRAEHLGGRFKTVGAVIGGAAGVYGGLHAATRAAKNPEIKKIPVQAKAKVKQKVGLAPRKSTVVKAWSPVADTPTLEARRQQRGRRYEQGAVGAAVGGAGIAAGAHHVARVAGAGSKMAEGRAVASKPPPTREATERVEAFRSLRAQKARAERSAKTPVNLKARIESAASGEKKIRAGVKAERANANATIKASMETASHLKGTASTAKKVRGRGALIGAAGAGAAAVIHHQRKGSWKPYPGIS